MRFLLMPFAMLFRLITSVRGVLFDAGVLATLEVSPAVKVIVIGNITAGGTGKTPLTAMIARLLQARGVRTGVVSRGYKGTYDGIVKVPTDGADAKKFGDEPSWMAQELGAQTPVYIGRKRVEAAREMSEKENVQVILADDAYQHRRLKCDFNIAIIDATEPLWHYHALPWGRAREPFSALNRADAVVLNKVNFADAMQVKALREKIQLHLKSGVKIISLNYGLSGLQALGNDGEWPLSTLSELKVFLVSGLGRPASFEALVREHAAAISGHLAFRDHHAYDKRDIAMIEKQALRAGAQALVMTQKDAVKLRGSVFSLPVLVTCLDLQGPGCDELDQEIRKKNI